MRDYVVRRAAEEKRYREVADENDVGYEWLCKLARDEIPNPGAERIERLFYFYKRLEKKRRAA